MQQVAAAVIVREHVRKLNAAAKLQVAAQLPTALAAAGIQVTQSILNGMANATGSAPPATKAVLGHAMEEELEQFAQHRDLGAPTQTVSQQAVAAVAQQIASTWQKLSAATKAQVAAALDPAQGVPAFNNTKLKARSVVSAASGQQIAALWQNLTAKAQQQVAAAVAPVLAKAGIQVSALTAASAALALAPASAAARR